MLLFSPTVVTTLVGSNGAFIDVGVVSGVGLDAFGNVLATDGLNNYIRAIAPSGGMAALFFELVLGGDLTWLTRRLCGQQWFRQWLADQ